MFLSAFSSELLLTIASYLPQVQLLNLSLVCKQLHVMIQPELYREYKNPSLYSRSLLPFIRKLVDRPELTKYVRRVDLHPYVHSLYEVLKKHILTSFAYLQMGHT